MSLNSSTYLINDIHKNYFFFIYPPPPKKKNIHQKGFLFCFLFEAYPKTISQNKVFLLLGFCLRSLGEQFCANLGMMTCFTLSWWKEESSDIHYDFEHPVLPESEASPGHGVSHPSRFAGRLELCMQQSKTHKKLQFLQ